MKEKHETRVLGRVLAVEETAAVSGAAPLTTFPPKDTGYVYDIIPVESQDAMMSTFQVKSF